MQNNQNGIEITEAIDIFANSFYYIYITYVLSYTHWRGYYIQKEGQIQNESNEGIQTRAHRGSQKDRG